MSGKVSTWEWGTELFQVPLFEQRGGFQRAVTLKAADNTEFEATPLYSYRVIKDKAIDVVFDNKHIGNGDGFMRSLEDNILEPRIYDLIKEESRKYKTDTLMADGGSLAFEKQLEDIVRAEFKERGLDLKSFSAQLEFSKRVREKIDNRNEVNTNISVIDQKIEEQKKAIRSGYDMDIIPSDLATFGSEAKNLLQDLQSRNERMFLVTFLVLNTADNPRQLDNNVFQASSIAQKYNCQLTRLDFQQEEG